VWFEFLCGPITAAQTKTMRAFVQELLPFGEEQAVAAAELFSADGRKRSTRVDAMIAATAIASGAALATNNQPDFRAFLQSGLRFAEKQKMA